MVDDIIDYSRVNRKLTNESLNTLVKQFWLVCMGGSRCVEGWWGCKCKDSSARGGSRYVEGCWLHRPDKCKDKSVPHSPSWRSNRRSSWFWVSGQVSAETDFPATTPPSRFPEDGFPDDGNTVLSGKRLGVFVGRVLFSSWFRWFLWCLFLSKWLIKDCGWIAMLFLIF